MQCMHSGTYADDCLVERVKQVRILLNKVLSTLSFSRYILVFFSLFQHKCFIVATCDKDLKRRIRKVPGVPIMFISHRR